MQIVVDGLPEEVPAKTTIRDLLMERDEPTDHIIVERNGSFVHPRDYAAIKLQPSDRIEVVFPAFGG